MPALLAGIGLYALYRDVEVFSVFLTGAKKGLEMAVGILPTLIGLLTAVCMLRASGAIDLAGRLLAPVLSVLGIPEECTALALLKPVSGGGGLALGSELMRVHGADSYVGRVAAVMLSASETSIYTIGVYCGHLGIKNTRYAVPAALTGDVAAFVAAAFFVRVFF